MVLEELVDKLVKRLSAVERALKEKGVLDEAEVIPGGYPVMLPLELGERIRAMNEPDTIHQMSVKGEDRQWLIHQLKTKLEDIDARLKALEDRLVLK